MTPIGLTAEQSRGKTIKCLFCPFSGSHTSHIIEHMWQQHPLLMKRKKNLLPMRKRPISESQVAEAEMVEQNVHSAGEPTPKKFSSSWNLTENSLSHGIKNLLVSFILLIVRRLKSSVVFVNVN